MKKTVVLLLSLSILLSALGQSLIFSHYLLNKKYYAAVLCENKAKPAMHCNGKCHLSKELKKQEKKERNAPSSIKEKQETVQFFQEDLKLSFYSFINSANHPVFYLDSKAQSVVFSIFHPPTV